MIRTRSSFVLLVLCACCLVSGDSVADNRPVVYASNYPLYFFATEIAGDEAEVRLPEIGGDPARWTPGAEQVADLQSAELVLLNGAGYEGWLDFVSLREERLVDTTAGIRDRLLPLEEETVHQHGPEGEHSHAGTAFTTWLNPQLAVAQAEAIAAALVRLSPGHEAAFTGRLARLSDRLNQLDLDLAQTFEALGNQPLLFSHPVYQYLQARYRVNGRSVHWEPEIAPGTRDWLDLNQLLARHPARVMVWEGEPLVEVGERLNQLGIVAAVFEIVEKRPVQGGYFEVMERNRKRLLDVSE
jgi:zinc transport system substrate-binding protein